MKKILLLPLLVLLVNACNIYSFSGISIDPSLETFTVRPIEISAPLRNPVSANVLREAFMDRMYRQTKLRETSSGGDIEYTMDIVGYQVDLAGISTTGENPNNRFRVTVECVFYNASLPEGKQTKTVRSSENRDFDATSSFSAVEEELFAEMTASIIDDIFNQTLNDW